MFGEAPDKVRLGDDFVQTKGLGKSWQLEEADY